MNRSLVKILAVVALTIAYASCENEGIRPVDHPGKWVRLPDHEIAKVKLWLENRASDSPIAGETSEIMWGTARYRKVSKNAFVISALVAEDNNKVFKTAYIYSSAMKRITPTFWGIQVDVLTRAFRESCPFMIWTET